MKQHLEKINSHKLTRHTKRVIKIKIYVALFILLPFVVLTFLASRTDILPGIKSYVVQTGSMEPTIPTGSVTYTQKADEYKKGDIISFKNESDQTITHRIIKVNKKDSFTTKGDANNTPDSSLVTKSSIVGKVTYSIPHVGKIINFLQTPKGFLITIILPTVLFVFLELWNIKKEIEKSTEERVLKRLQSTSN